MTLHRSIVALIATVMIGVAAWAQQVRVQLSNPGTQIQGNTFSLTVTAVNVKLSEIKPPQLKGCKLLRSTPGMSTQQSMSNINGKVTQSFQIGYSYIYRAETAGTVNVPALTVSSGEQTFQTQPTSFKILPADSKEAKEAQAAAQRRSYGYGGYGYGYGYDPYEEARREAEEAQRMADAAQPPAVKGTDLLVRVTFSKNKVYEQEPIIAEIKVYTRHGIKNFRVETQPVFDGFLSEELEVKPEVKMEHYNGQNYYTAVLKRCILYPQRAGTLTVNSGKYKVTIEQAYQVPYGRYMVQTKVADHDLTTTSNQVSLNVLPLPTPKPAGFAGAVGSFTLRSQLSPAQLRTNEVATLQAVISGTGNIKYLKAPALTLPPGIEGYTPKTTIDSRATGNNIAGTFSIDYPLMPRQMGKVEIPAIDFVYFNPADGQYHTISSQPVVTTVAKGTAPAPGSSQALSDKMTDILHIQHYRPAEGQPLFTTAAYWLAIAAMFAAFGLVLFIYRRQLKLRADVAGRRYSRANRIAKRRLRAAERVMAQPNDKFYEEITKALYGYFGDKLGIPPSQLIRENIAEQLASYGAQPENIQQAIDVLDECEMARFTPEDSRTPRAQIYEQAADVIKAFEDVRPAPKTTSTDNTYNPYEQ